MASNTPLIERRRIKTGNFKKNPGKGGTPIITRKAKRKINDLIFALPAFTAPPSSSVIPDRLIRGTLIKLYNSNSGFHWPLALSKVIRSSITLNTDEPTIIFLSGLKVIVNRGIIIHLKQHTTLTPARVRCLIKNSGSSF